jgi:hypothetical protein
MTVTRQPPLSVVVDPLQKVRLEEPCLLTGKITSVTMHFPDGCNGLVHIAFGHNNTWLFPSLPETYISLDGATPTFPCDEKVGVGDYVWAIIVNGDGVNAHAVSVLPTLQGEEQK